MNPYDIPHSCERESVATILAKLNRRQRRAVRSYVREVEHGSMTLTEWIAVSPDSPSLSTWRKPGGNYWGTEEQPGEDFREAVSLYVAAWSNWETREEEKAIRAAGRALRLATPVAVAQLTSVIEQGQVAFDRADAVVVKQASVAEMIRAALSVLDRAGLETAEKSTTEFTGMTLEEWRGQQADRRVQVQAALADFADLEDSSLADDESATQ